MQFYTDFSDYAVGPWTGGSATPSPDWSGIAGGDVSAAITSSSWTNPASGTSVALTGGKALVLSGPGSAGLGGLLYTGDTGGGPGEPAPSRVEVAMKFLSSAESSGAGVFFVVRMGTDLSHRCYAGGGYSWGGSPASRVYFWTGATLHMLTSVGAPLFAADTFLGSRFSIEGADEFTHVRSSVWRWDDDAPDFGESTAALLDWFDPAGAVNITGSGFVGICTSDSSIDHEYVIDRMGIGSDGDPAPLAPSILSAWTACPVLSAAPWVVRP